MNEPVIEVEGWRDARLVCGIGHTYPGRVRVVRTRAFDSDGEPMWREPSDEYDPARCVVCGLLTWSRQP
jgi:hypothetical protein